MKESTIKKRFWEKVRKTDTCWEWTAFKDKYGYGKIWESGGMKLVHRVSWELHYGKIPDGLCVLHHCDNPVCVYPKHLFLGTQSENMHDMKLKGRAGSLRGEDSYSSKLRESQVREILKSKLRGVLIAQIYGVTAANIYSIRARKSWRHLQLT